MLAGRASQLAEYFAGERHDFDLPLAPAGTPFQQRVWQALREIPYGETTTYGELAAGLGQPTRLPRGRPGQRAQPDRDHRAVPPGDRRRRALTGYGGGLARKRWLLDHERAVLAATTGEPLAAGLW